MALKGAPTSAGIYSPLLLERRKPLGVGPSSPGASASPLQAPQNPFNHMQFI